MKKHTYFFPLLITIGLSAHAEFKHPDEIVKEFKEPGHIPQGLKPSKYHKLNEVIPQHIQDEIKSKRAKKKKGEPEIQAEPTVTLPQSVDLRKYDSYIRNQWDGTCTAHGLIAGMENLFNRSKDTTLSTRYFWNQYQRYSAEAAISAATRYKQIDEVYWPQNKSAPVEYNLISKAKYKLVNQEYLGDDITKVVKALAQGYPVYVAMSVPQDMASCRSSIRYSTGVTSGGHAILINAYWFDSRVQGGVFVAIKNSWSANCGDHGYQYFPLALCQKSSMYCAFWALKGVEG